MRKLLQRLIGRPAADFVEFLFTDFVSGKPVNLYEVNGKRFMANSAWGLFRVSMDKDK